MNPEILREFLHYEPLTGIFTWRVWRGGGSPKVGARAGYFPHGPRSEGYMKIRIGGRGYFAHRLAWLYSYGKFPTLEIDHINGNRSDNSLINLREVSKSVNQHNRFKSRKDSKIGLRGVTKNHRGFRASIRIQGTLIYLGTYKTPELAHKAYLSGEKKYVS